jgi:NAD(P)-dependent dehydrogenase (short-subunit alcohol dehydrogenase family)
VFTPVLAKHSSLIDCLSVGVDRMQRTFEPMRKQVEAWQKRPPAKGFIATNHDGWRKALDQNFLSTVYFAHEVIPHMQAKRWGRILTITSITTKHPVPDLVLSNAVRAAVVG